MKHYDEHTLELYALGSDLDDDIREEIASHLLGCHGCAQLVARIEQFYALAEHTMATQTPPDHREATALTRRAIDLKPISGGSHTLSIARRFSSILRRHPVAAGFVGILATAALSAALLIGYRTIGRDLNPSMARVSEQDAMFQVFNAQGELLWQKPLRNTDIGTRPEFYFELRDVEGDARNEVLTTLPLLSYMDGRTTALHIFSGDGHFLRSPNLGHDIAYQGRHYQNDFGARHLLVDSAAANRRPNIFVNLTGGRSPSAIVKIGPDGNMIGEYWNFGVICGVFAYDVNGDGAPEIVVYGRDDSEEESGNAYPFIAALDPSKLMGLSSSSTATGFGYGRSAAELAYIRLPRTDLNVATFSQPVVWRHEVVHSGNTRVLRFLIQGAQGTKMDFEYLFGVDLRPIQVLSTSWTEDLVRNLRNTGKSVGPIDAAYLRGLRDSIRQWDGKGWRTLATEDQPPDRP